MFSLSSLFKRRRGGDNVQGEPGYKFEPDEHTQYENRRFLILIGAIVATVLGTLVSLVSMVNHDHTKDTVLVTGFVGVMMTQLFSAVRAEQARRSASKNQEEIKDKVETAKKEIVETAIVPALANPSPEQIAMPANPVELREMIHTIVGELMMKMNDDACRKLVEDSAAIAAHKAVEEMKGEIERMVKGSQNSLGGGWGGIGGQWIPPGTK